MKMQHFVDNLQKSKGEMPFQWAISPRISVATSGALLENQSLAAILDTARGLHL
jgi:hypothetical protein